VLKVHLILIGMSTVASVREAELKEANSKHVPLAKVKAK
jgi:hypothetical protein